MAGDWIGLDHELSETDEVLGIFERTDVEIGTIIGRLFLMWRWFDKMTVDGKLPSVGLRALSAKCGGDVGFWQAVASVKWLVVTEEGIEMPDFEKRIGKSARARMKEARRKKDYENRRSDDNSSARQSPSSPDERGKRAETSRETRGKRAETARQLSESESLQEPNPKQTTTTNRPASETTVTSVVRNGATPVSANWGGVAEGLKELGVKRTGDAIESAKGSGFNPPQVLALIAWLKQQPDGAYGPGVLVERLTQQEASTWDVHEAWPPPNGTVVPSEPDRYAKPKKTAQQISAEDREAKERRKRFLETERLNAPFIDVLDAMSEEGLRELVSGERLIASQLRAKGRDSPDVRPFLLKLLRDRESVPA